MTPATKRFTRKISVPVSILRQVMAYLVMWQVDQRLEAARLAPSLKSCAPRNPAGEVAQRTSQGQYTSGKTCRIASSVLNSGASRTMLATSQTPFKIFDREGEER